MGALAQFLERAGVATTHVSLVREHTEIMRPPRALWVPFMLGRPFGAPNAPAFQRRVLVAALRLLEAAQGPVLEEFPEEAPVDVGGGDDAQGLACPISLAPRAGADPAQELLDEISQLQAWHDIGARRTGRAATRLTGMQIEAVARFAASYLGAAPQPSGDARMSPAAALKRACDDLKAFYLEAACAQPGNPDAAVLEQWFWRETAAGRFFLMLRDACMASADEGLRQLGNGMLVPRAILHPESPPRTGR